MASNTSFLRNFKGTEDFLAELKKPNMLGKIMQYFDEAMDKGTLTEKRDATKLMLQVTGLLKEHRQNTHEFQGLPKEERDKNLARVLEIVKKGKRICSPEPI